MDNIENKNDSNTGTAGNTGNSGSMEKAWRNLCIFGSVIVLAMFFGMLSITWAVTLKSELFLFFMLLLLLALGVAALVLGIMIYRKRREIGELNAENKSLWKDLRNPKVLVSHLIDALNDKVANARDEQEALEHIRSLPLAMIFGTSFNEAIKRDFISVFSALREAKHLSDKMALNLWLHASACCSKVAEFMLDEGIIADVNVKDENGRTALHWVAIGTRSVAPERRKQFAQWLIEKGVVRVKDRFGKTPEQYQIENMDLFDVLKLAPDAPVTAVISQHGAATADETSDKGQTADGPQEPTESSQPAAVTEAQQHDDESDDGTAEQPQGHAAETATVATEEKPAASTMLHPGSVSTFKGGQLEFTEAVSGDIHRTQIRGISFRGDDDANTIDIALGWCVRVVSYDVKIPSERSTYSLKLAGQVVHETTSDHLIIENRSTGELHKFFYPGSSELLQVEPEDDDASEVTTQERQHHQSDDATAGQSKKHDAETATTAEEPGHGQEAYAAHLAAEIAESADQTDESSLGEAEGKQPEQAADQTTMPQLSNDLLGEFFGGQLSFNDQRDGHLCRAIIESAGIQDDKLRVDFERCMMLKDVWEEKDTHGLVRKLENCDVKEAAEDKIFIELPDEQKCLIFFPPNSDQLLDFDAELAKHVIAEEQPVATQDEEGQQTAEAGDVKPADVSAEEQREPEAETAGGPEGQGQEQAGSAEAAEKAAPVSDSRDEDHITEESDGDGTNADKDKQGD